MALAGYASRWHTGSQFFLVGLHRAASRCFGCRLGEPLVCGDPFDFGIPLLWRFIQCGETHRFGGGTVVTLLMHRIDREGCDNSSTPFKASAAFSVSDLRLLLHCDQVRSSPLSE